MTAAPSPPGRKRMRPRTAIGMAATAAWIAFGIWVLFTSSRPTALNEWGDAMAGFFAPLAFLWLVIGYMQQGEELRLSTEALHLQASELKNSVEQQSALVDVSRQQLEQELLRIEEERSLRLQADQPIWILSQANALPAEQPNHYRFTVNVANIGRTATSVEISWTPFPMEPVTAAAYGHVESGTQFIISFVPVPRVEYRLAIIFIDGGGRRRSRAFYVQHVEPGATLWLHDLDASESGRLPPTIGPTDARR